MRILVVEDDARTSEFVQRGLVAAGHDVDVLSDGKSAQAQAHQGGYDVMVVDRMLPGLDGLQLVKNLRQDHIATPVIFLTALGGIDDRVEGFEAGGDDYLVKPFALAELTARLSALGRRPAAIVEQTRLVVADLELDLVRRSCQRAGTRIDLLPREFTLLEYLMRNENRTVTKSMLLERIWEFSFDPQTSVVETQISRLRNKIDKPFDRPLLHTVRNIGYTLHA
jgi:two-component system OmpR family response regulator